jgi:hypothetical protein
MELRRGAPLFKFEDRRRRVHAQNETRNKNNQRSGDRLNYPSIDLSKYCAE